MTRFGGMSLSQCLVLRQISCKYYCRSAMSCRSTKETSRRLRRLGGIGAAAACRVSGHSLPPALADHAHVIQPGHSFLYLRCMYDSYEDFRRSEFNDPGLRPCGFPSQVSQPSSKLARARSQVAGGLLCCGS